MSIKVPKDNLEKLAKDVVFFANKVKHITLVESKYFRVFDRMHASTVWLDVISSCTYLTTITIRTEFASDYIIRFKMNTTANRQSLHALDFVQFLKAAPRVKEFDAETLCEIKSDWRTVIPANLSLNLLDLTVAKMDLDSLMFIIACSKKIKNLRIRIKYLMKSLSMNWKSLH